MAKKERKAKLLILCNLAEPINGDAFIAAFKINTKTRKAQANKENK
jgi:hypothetical protein